MITDFDKAMTFLSGGLVDFGDLNVFGEVIGGGGYADLLPHSREVFGFGVRFRLVNLDKLIALKRAAGRPRDLQVIAELQGILERQRE